MRAGTRNRLWRALATVLVAMTLGLLLADSSHACSVCFGDPDSPMTHGMNNAIVLLLGIVALVQVGFAKLFWDIRKRSKRLAARRENFRLVDGGLQ